MRYVHSLRREFRANGFLGTLRFLGRRVLRWQTCEVYLRKAGPGEVQESPDTDSAGIEMIVLREEMGAERVRAEIAAEFSGSALEEYAETILLGASLYLFRQGGSIVHYAFVKTHDPSPAVWRSRPGEPVILNCHTPAQARGQGHYPRALERIFRHQIHSGQRSVYVAADTWNTPSLRGIRKAGFGLLGTYRAVVLLNHLVLRLKLSGESDEKRIKVLWR